MSEACLLLKVLGQAARLTLHALQGTLRGSLLHLGGILVRQCRAQLGLRPGQLLPAIARNRIPQKASPGLHQMMYWRLFAITLNRGELHTLKH